MGLWYRSFKLSKDSSIIYIYILDISVDIFFRERGVRGGM